jgi:hypothetical protein
LGLNYIKRHNISKTLNNLNIGLKIALYSKKLNIMNITEYHYLRNILFDELTKNNIIKNTDKNFSLFDEILGKYLNVKWQN